jgi:hypothetical protein
MTIQVQDSVQSLVFIPRDYDVFAGIDVDKKSTAVIFTDHEQLMQSLRLPYSAAQLLNYAESDGRGDEVRTTCVSGWVSLG